ncbi:autophagy protein 5 [Spiromyces aspiralis]|uniref:Autophagy protein 5 n=1 Tax=Spiromyces aspiralis TaxID=68401 RepID=A0ACC1HIX0_9FUNG|nr:autophagy protein 5 [Spiromyces aspiralis]
MDEEREITQRLWSGYIPLELHLAPADAVELLASPTLPEPFQTFYILAPQGSYLPFLTKRIREQWLDPLWTLGTTTPGVGAAKDPINESDFWFDVDGVPLKWHYPIGLLYDIHENAVPLAQRAMRENDRKRGDSISTSTSAKKRTDSGDSRRHSRASLDEAQAEDRVCIPWRLTLHLRKFPADKLIRSPSSQAIRDIYMSMVKEVGQRYDNTEMADYLRFGSTKRVMDLSKADQTQLLDGLESHSFEQYHAIHTLLSSMPNVSSMDNDSGLPRHIPVRWYLLPRGSFQPEHVVVVQDLISPVHAVKDKATAARGSLAVAPRGSQANGAWVTLAEAFKQVYPSAVPLPVDDENSNKSNAAGKNSKDSEDDPSALVAKRWKCWSQGIQPPWNTPLIWMSSNLAYPDGFLHIILVESR